MIVIALNRRKITTYFKLSLIIITIFTFVFLVFQQLPQRVSFEKWNASNDHPGRVLRVNFDLEESNTSEFQKTLKKMKEYYQGSSKSH